MDAHTHSASRSVSMLVGGMDCSSCVAKIETALNRVPGVSAVELNFATTRLRLTLASDAATEPRDIERLIRSLGFEVDAAPFVTVPGEQTGSHSPDRTGAHTHAGGHEHGHVCADEVGHSCSHDHAKAYPPGHSHPQVGGPADRRWWQTQKGILVLMLGALMGGAYVLAWMVPAVDRWVFAVAVLAGVWPFARQAWALARAGTPFSIETLMSVAALGALAIGEAEEAAAVVFLFALGELLEGVAAGRARAGIRALATLVPSRALRVDSQGKATDVPAASLRKGDTILVRPGDKVPADGVIIEGSSSIDASPLTGESMPQPRSPGEGVHAGTINLEGALRVRVDKVGADSTISRIIHLVEEAQAQKAPVARFIERFSRYYTPAVMAIALLVVLVPPVALGADWQTWLYRGLALLLIACPCALVLSTPAAVASALAAGTRRGLLIKGGNALERIGRVKWIAFDKTGTLTEGKPKVTDVVACHDEDQAGVLALAAAVEAGSTHPLARAVVKEAEALGLTVPAATQARAVIGAGAHAWVQGRALVMGSPAYAQRVVGLAGTHLVLVEALQLEGKTVMVLFDEEAARVLGILAVRDEPRPDAERGVERLKAMGVHPVMLTGDHERAAGAIAGGLGMEYQAALLPADKLRVIGDLKAKGGVAMVGDGINDAPALALADVGVAMGGGTDVALETADAALLESRVADVARMVALSRATLANIRQNVVVALGLKAVFLLTTVLGVTGLWVAVLADTGATALVTLNALRLLRFRDSASSDRSSGSET